LGPPIVGPPIVAAVAIGLAWAVWYGSRPAVRVE
jgi:hypothetical protein